MDPEGIMTCSLANIWQTSESESSTLARKLRSGVLIPDEVKRRAQAQKGSHSKKIENQKRGRPGGQRPEQDHRRSAHRAGAERQTRPGIRTRRSPEGPSAGSWAMERTPLRCLGLICEWFDFTQEPWADGVLQTAEHKAKKKGIQDFLAVQSTSNAVGTDSLPGRGTKFTRSVPRQK